MPSVLISFREAKEPDASGQPYLKSSIKEKGKKGKARKRESQKARKSQRKKKVRQEKSGKSSPQGMVSGHTGTPKSRKKTPLKMQKDKKETSVSNTSSKRRFDITV